MLAGLVEVLSAQVLQDDWLAVLIDDEQLFHSVYLQEVECRIVVDQRECLLRFREFALYELQAKNSLRHGVIVLDKHLLSKTQ
jgi:hypothetical protein